MSGSFAKARRCRAVRSASMSLAIAVAVSGITQPLRAADRYWVGGNGFWDEAIHWSTTPGGAGGASVPVNGDNAFINSTTSITVTRDNATPGYTAPGPALVRFGGTGGAVVTVAEIAGANAMVATEEDVGYAGTGQYLQSGGTNTTNALVVASGSVGSVGTYTLSGAGTSLNVNTLLDIAEIDNDAGTFLQSNGTVTTPFTEMAVGVGSRAVYNLTGGVLSSGFLLLGVPTPGATGIATLSQSGGTLSFTNGMTINPGSRVLLTGGVLLDNGSINVNGGTFTSNTGVTLVAPLTVANNGYFSVADEVFDEGASITLQTGGALIAPVRVTLGVNGTGLTLDGGRLSTGSIGGIGGVVFNSGTLNLTGNASLSASSNLGNAIELPFTRSLEIGGTTTLSTLSSVTLSGGTFSTGTLSGTGSVLFNSGTFRLTGSNLTIASGGPFGATFQINTPMHVEVTNAHLLSVFSDGLLDLAGGSLLASGGISNSGIIQLDGLASRLSGGALANNGILSGVGRIENTLTNNSTGTVRLGNADHLLMTGVANSSAGTIQLLGGILEFQQGLTNTGTITGRGTFIANLGLTNNGSIIMDSGPSDVFGLVINGPTSHTLVTGGANVTFHGFVTNQSGSQFKVSNASIAAFLSLVSGIGAFTGAGTTIFEASTIPGPLATGGTSIVETTGALSVTSIRQPALIVRGTSTIVADGSSAATSVLQSLTIDGATMPGRASWT